MSAELDALLAKLKGMLTFEQRDRAFDLANTLVKQFPHDMRVWWMRGNVHLLKENSDGALDDFSSAITIDSNEPALFFDRGRTLLSMEQDRSAISDFTTALALCDRYVNDYYRELLHLMRAEAHIRLRDKKRAEQDLACVTDTGTIWTYRLCTKSTLLAECRALSE